MDAPVLAVNVTDTRYGPMQYFASDSFIGRSLELYGEYSQGEIELLAKVVKPSWTIVNGGANIGALTVGFADLVTNGTVHAFEPHPDHFRLLEANCCSRANIRLHKLALSHCRGDSRMRQLIEMADGNFGGIMLDPGGAVVVRAVALDDMGIEHVDLIMLDIEGCERDALEGAREIIARDRPLLYLEDLGKRDDSGETDLTRYVRSLGYVIYNHRPSLFSPDNHKGYEENVFVAGQLGFAEIVSFNVLCVPTERREEFALDLQPAYRDDNKRGQLAPQVPKFPHATSGWAAICRMGGVGDNLIAASTCRPLKQLGFKVEVITQNPHAVIFQNNPFVDKISAYNYADWPTDLTSWQSWFQMRSKEYDRFANLSHSCEALCAAFKIQTAFWWPDKFRRQLFDRNYLESVHDILDLPHTFGPLFFPTEDEREQARVTKQALKAELVIGWVLSGTRIDKIYPQSPQVVARLIKELGAHVVLMGAPTISDLEQAKGIMQGVESYNGSIKGLSHAASPSIDDQTWPIRRILTFAATCDLYIGMDTGPSWGVAFEPIPKIILLSHASPTNITKHWVNAVTLHADQKRVDCWPCHRLHDSYDTCRPNKWGNGAACISDIDTETVVRTARQLLQRGSNVG